MLELQHISYETEENCEILHDISLTVNDRFVAITGPNGGGKSTLAKIIAGIYTPTEGRILLDGHDLRDYDLHSLYGLFGMIFQDFGRYAATAADMAMR